MKWKSQHLLETLLGSHQAFTMQNRVLNAVTLCAACAAFTIFFSDLILPEAPTRFWLSFAAALAFSALYWIGRRRNESDTLVWTFILVFYAIIIFDFVSVGGITGHAFTIAVAMAAAIPMVRSGVQMVAALAGLAIVLAGLTLFEWVNPQAVVPYGSRVSQMADLFVTTSLLAGAVALLVLMLVSSYRRQQAEVQSLNRCLEIVNRAFSERNRELERAAEEIKTLRGILPICSFCKKIRNDLGAYEAIEEYITLHSEAMFSHTLCPDCFKREYPDAQKDLEQKGRVDEASEGQSS